MASLITPIGSDLGRGHSPKPLAPNQAGVGRGAAAAWAAVLLSLAVGAVFRLAWVQDMEYKVDEAWVFELVRDFFREGRFVWLGMPSSQNVRIPGLSIWAFYPLGAVFGTDDPTGLARGVQVMSLLALAGLAAFAWRCVPADEREWWLWAVALLCVNPLVVLVQRKIWPPSLMPAGLVLLVACWWHRGRWWGALGWGLANALLAQIHIGMAFYAAGVVGYTLLSRRKGTAWRWWLIGSLLGAFPALPWFWYLASPHEGANGNALALSRLGELKFFSHWVSEPLGVGLGYHLGKQADDLLAWPVVAGWPTYGVAVAQFACAGLGLWVIGRAFVRWVRRKPRVLWVGAGRCHTDLLLGAVFWGFGLVLTLTCLPFYRHYLMLAFPFTLLWIARLALPYRAGDAETRHGRRVLLGMWLASAVLTGSALLWLHQNGGSAAGGYGRSYAHQLRHGEKPNVPPLSAR